MIDQDEAAMSEGEGANETEREQEKLGLRGGKKVRVRVIVRFAFLPDGCGVRNHARIPDSMSSS